MTMGTYTQIMDELKRLGISHTMVDHPAAETTEEADRYIAGHEGVRTKSMFLKDKKKNFYLLIMDDKKRLDFHEFQDITGTKRISMARPNDIQEQLGLAPGIISPFGLMNNEDHNVKVLFDKEMLDEPILTFHPNENTHTIFLKTDDVLHFVNEQGFEYEVIDL
ncbi:prolyl-tRNA synthetase associated domain-containing protein [Lactobacillaceae bacterium 24-114]